MVLTKDLSEQLFVEALRNWNLTFGGVSALDLARNVNLPHEEAMRVVEAWVDAGRGTMNANVVLSQISFPSPGTGGQISCTPVTTHIFFPSKYELTENFFHTGQARTEPPEFKKRLMCGEHQLALCFFTEEVLTRYFNHPDWYDVDDSTAGGTIRTKSDSPSDRRINVQFGKGKSEDGRTFVTAIYKDLYNFSEIEQRHWHAHEISRPTLDVHDNNFELFAARTYDGAWVDFPKPIEQLQDALAHLNRIFHSSNLFGRLENGHLRMPVENTNKALADSCSELYKIVGPDSLKASPLRSLLQSMVKMDEADFYHSSGRPLSSLQLLELTEAEMGISAGLSNAIKAIGERRIEADHKVIETKSSNRNAGEDFLVLCNEVTESAKRLAVAISSRKVA